MDRKQAAEILFDEAAKRDSIEHPASFRNDRIAAMVAGEQDAIRAFSLIASPKNENAEGDVAEAVSTLIAPIG